MGDYSIVYVRNIPNQQPDWQERVHNFCMYPMALANGKFVEVTADYQFSSQQTRENICHLFMKLVAYTILCPLTLLGTLAGRCSITYAQKTEQYAWTLASEELKTFAWARKVFPTQVIASVVEAAQGKIPGKGDQPPSTTNKYMADFLAAVSQDEALQDELRNNPGLVACVAPHCHNVDDFMKVTDILLVKPDHLHLFMRTALGRWVFAELQSSKPLQRLAKENRVFAAALLGFCSRDEDYEKVLGILKSDHQLSALFPALAANEKLCALFAALAVNESLQEELRVNCDLITYVAKYCYTPERVSMLLNILQDSDLLYLFVSHVLSTWGNDDPCSSEKLQHFFSSVPIEKVGGICTLIGRMKISKEKQEAIWRGLLEGKLENLSDEDLMKFYNCFYFPGYSPFYYTGIPNKGDPELLVHLLYPRPLEGEPLAKAIISLHGNGCLTKDFIDGLTVKQYLSIPTKVHNRGDITREDLPAIIQVKFAYLEPPAEAEL